MTTVYRIEDDRGWGPYGWVQEYEPDQWTPEREALVADGENCPVRGCVAKLDDGLTDVEDGMCADGFRRRTGAYDVEKPASEAGKWTMAHHLAVLSGHMRFGFSTLKQAWDWFHPAWSTLEATGYKLVAYDVPDEWLLHGECQVGYVELFADKVGDVPFPTARPA